MGRAKAIMIQGCGSGVGKSLITAGLCRVFRQDGHRVAPFKSQNMALNSFVTADGGEMGRAQVMQAEAAGITPTVDMNPVLLKPSSDTSAQVIVQGEVYNEIDAKNFFSARMEHRAYLAQKIKESYEWLASDYEILVIEGAGSPAEINLREMDLVNIFMAETARAPVLLVGDIDKGGVFASLAGTLLIISEYDRSYIKGFIINKFRGDKSLLDPGLAQIEEITKRPVLGVIPYQHLDIDEEDSYRDRAIHSNRSALIHIAVVRLPHISNFTDFSSLERAGSVFIDYTIDPRALAGADLIIIPGTKNTGGDLRWLRENSIDTLIDKLARKGKPIFGICGGFQILGHGINDPEGVEGGGSTTGLGLLPIDTVFERQKTLTQVKGIIDNVGGVFAALSGLDFIGYEIHNGRSTVIGGQPPSPENPSPWLINEGNVYGTYVHGIFDAEETARCVVRALYKARGIDYDEEFYNTKSLAAYKEEQYDKLADLIRNNLDMKKVYQILEEGV